MKIIETLVKEMETEAQTTRKMLTLVPFDKVGWKPHPKSMSIDSLATHLAELPGWASMTLNTEELDFEKTPYSTKTRQNADDLMAFFDQNLKSGLSDLKKSDNSSLDSTWTLRSGNQVYSTGTRAEFLRIIFCQIVHHRAQLGVYLRLLNIPIPGSYGPSADEAGS